LIFIFSTGFYDRNVRGSEAWWMGLASYRPKHSCPVIACTGLITSSYVFRWYDVRWQACRICWWFWTQQQYPGFVFSLHCEL